MNLAEYSSYDAVGLSELVRKKQISPTELAKTAFAALEKVNPHLNAVAELYNERIDALDEKNAARWPLSRASFHA